MFNLKNIFSHFNPGSLKKYFANTSWLMFERFLRIITLLVIGAYVARYLGPHKFGILNYAISFVALFIPLSNMGLDSIVVRNLVRRPDNRDLILGSAFVMKLFASIVIFFAISFISPIINNDALSNIVTLIIAISLILQSFDVLDFYFQSKVQSKFIVQAKTIQLLLSSGLKIIFIIIRAPLVWFAYIYILDRIILSAGLIFNYIKKSSSILYWKSNVQTIVELLKDSWPLILSGVTISIYMKIDQIMLNKMLNSEAVGQYAAAVRLSEGWYFIPMVICSSIFPAIINAKNTSIELYHKRLQELYDLMIWLAIGIAVAMTFASHWIVKILYGMAYAQAGNILMIHIWAGVIVFFGIARHKWIISNNIQKKEIYLDIFGAILNILLNFVLIKRFGVIGAAYATLFGYFIASYVVALFIKEFRLSLYMFNKALLLPFRIIKNRYK